MDFEPRCLELVDWTKPNAVSEWLAWLEIVTLFGLG
jgi:hypothetical protein